MHLCVSYTFVCVFAHVRLGGVFGWVCVFTCNCACGVSLLVSICVCVWEGGGGGLYVCMCRHIDI